MWAKIIATLTGQTVGAVVEHLNLKRQLKANIKMEELRGKAEYQRAKTRRASESEGRDAEWEAMSIQNSGWKDEWVLVTLSIPMILVFVPWTQPTVMAGFEALAGTPLWYRVLIATIYLATFGIRMWRRDMSKATDVVGMIQ